MVLVFGTVCIDRVRRVPLLPGAGGYAEVEDERFLLGGEAANTANALRTWGTEVTLVGNGIGDGEAGSRLRSLLNQHGLESLETGAPTSHTPVCDVYVTPDGDRTMFGLGFAGASETVDPDRVPVRPGAWFTAEPNLGVVARCVVRRAVEAGMKTYLMDFFQPDDPVVTGSFWQSSTDWVGSRGNTQKNVKWVEDWVRAKGCFAILSDGPNGFVAGSPNHTVRAYPPFPSPQIVDTTGAGDLFRAGMLFGLSQDWAIPRCLQFASAAGCLKCRALGATTDVPSVAEIESLIAGNPAISRQYW